MPRYPPWIETDSERDVPWIGSYWSQTLHEAPGALGCLVPSELGELSGHEVPSVSGRAVLNELGELSGHEAPSVSERAVLNGPAVLSVYGYLVPNELGAPGAYGHSVPREPAAPTDFGCEARGEPEVPGASEFGAPIEPASLTGHHGWVPTEHGRYGRRSASSD